jgi:hypothetical protein
MNKQVIIATSSTDVFNRALLAGFEIVGSWPTRGPGPMGAPPSSVSIALRRDTPHGQTSGLYDFFAHNGAHVDGIWPPPEEWFGEWPPHA